MKLNSFKELLLKKSLDNQNLQVLIKYIRDDYLVEHVIESLEKMAASYSKKSPNAAVLHFGTNMDKDTEGDMFHDALSHHASHYKAALGAGNQQLANIHMGKIHKMMHMGEKLTRDGKEDHSDGKLKIESVDTKPWERTKFDKTTNRQGEEQGKFTTNTKGWGRQGPNIDYSYLQGAPHSSHMGEVKAHGHNKAYPLEEIKVNGKHIHIDDDIKLGEDGSAVDHPFDSHPIMSDYKLPPKSHGADEHTSYLDNVDKYHADGGGIDSYFDSIESRDPEEHSARGSEKSNAVHNEVDGLDLDGQAFTHNKPNATQQAELKEEEASEEKLPEKAPTLSEMKAKLAAIRGNK